jgi:hypothetical protein
VTVPEFKFGRCIGMDYEERLRLMVLCREDGPRAEMPWRRETWSAVVLTDDTRNPDHWEVGRIVTVSPNTAGIVIYEE